METVIIFAVLLAVFWSSISILKGSLNNTIQKGANVWDSELSIWELEANDKLANRKEELKSRLSTKVKEEL
jgi:hypothetical protein